MINIMKDNYANMLSGLYPPEHHPMLKLYVKISFLQNQFYDFILITTAIDNRKEWEIVCLVRLCYSNWQDRQKSRNGVTEPS